MASGCWLGLMVSPSINILGTYFPDWIFCAVGALVLTAILHRILRPTPWLSRMERPTRIILFVALGALLALVGWLIFFLD